VYGEYADDGKIGFQVCSECRATVFFPRRLCPSCWSVDLEWRTSAGTGTVYAATTLHPREAEPYTIGVVDLSEGFRVMCRLEGLPLDDVAVIGRSVEVRIVDHVLMGAPTNV
jgi:uncharacterized OB-fold protein